MLNKNTIDEKKGILDVRISTESGDKIEIEVQVVRKDSIIDRMLWYWAKLYSSELKAGEDYSKLKRTICILIADFEIDRFNMLTEFYTRWSITNNCHKEVKLTDKMDICIIELSKMEKKENYTDEERIELLKEKVDIQLISRTTGLSIEELEKLKDKIQ